jgi:hypothetical protein
MVSITGAAITHQFGNAVGPDAELDRIVDGMSDLPFVGRTTLSTHIRSTQFHEAIPGRKSCIRSRPHPRGVPPIPWTDFLCHFFLNDCKFLLGRCDVA